MQFMDRTLGTAAENLALDEALLLEAEASRSGEILRVWEWPLPAVVLGAGCRLTDDVDEAACQADGVPILRRASGGGTVLLARGCLCFSLVLAYSRSPALADVRASYRYILDRTAAALADLLPGVGHAGTSDLAADGRKISGNAQQRKRQFLLHHGTLLYNMDLSLVSRYLRLPERQPEYRGQRVHEEFLMNLLATAAELRCRLQSGWDAPDNSADWPQAMVCRLAEERYQREEWTRRR
jgi:lipoate-protein ligase A